MRPQDVCWMDLVLIARACGELSHVAELDLSCNGIGCKGIGCFVDEIAAPLAACWPMPAPLPLENVTILGLNRCKLGDDGISR